LSIEKKSVMAAVQKVLVENLAKEIANSSASLVPSPSLLPSERLPLRKISPISYY